MILIVLSVQMVVTLDPVCILKVLKNWFLEAVMAFKRPNFYFSF
jgi:hypothetical protein